MGQYFRKNAGLKPDWELDGLLTSYEEIQNVNIGMADRIRAISENDANTNSYIL